MTLTITFGLPAEKSLALFARTADLGHKAKSTFSLTIAQHNTGVVHCLAGPDAPESSDLVETSITTALNVDSVPHYHDESSPLLHTVIVLCGHH